MAGFSDESLKRIREALNAVPAGGTDFHVHLTQDEISAHYLWSEGFEVRFNGERYYCTHHMERATRYFEIPDEAEAVRRFISIACHAKRY